MEGTGAMKKVFWQISRFLYIGLLIFLGIAAAGVYVIVCFFLADINDKAVMDWIYLIVSIGAVLFCIYTIIRLGKNRIILLETEIFVPENWGNKDNRIQYETHIKYIEIKNIFITMSDKNSCGGESRWVFVPMPYIVFECNDGSQKAINVYFYTKKQVVKIMDLAIERAKSLGNNIDIKTGTDILLSFKESAKKKK